MNKLNAFMQDKYGMKSFTHTPETKQLPNLITETIKGKRFYVVGEENIHPLQQFCLQEIKKV